MIHRLTDGGEAVNDMFLLSERQLEGSKNHLLMCLADNFRLLSI